MLDRRIQVPLWRQLFSVLKRELESGALTAFPTEQGLVERFGVSRHTVREALRELRAHGLIERRRGAGTFIARPPLEQPLGTMYSIAPAVRRYGEHEHIDVLAQGFEVHEPAARALRLPPNEPVAALERLRIVDDEPLMVVRSWYEPRVGRALFREPLREQSVYELLDTRLNLRVTSAQERIHASIPTEYERGLLRMPPGEAVLRVERLGFHLDRPVEYRQSIVRGDRFVFVADWPSAGDATGEPRLTPPGEAAEA